MTIDAQNRRAERKDTRAMVLRHLPTLLKLQISPNKLKAVAKQIAMNISSAERRLQKAA